MFAAVRFDLRRIDPFPGRVALDICYLRIMAEQPDRNHPDQYNIAFRKALEALNEAQLQAVSHIEGPVLVIAGPGTGKTQILAARIGKILNDTDTADRKIVVTGTRLSVRVGHVGRRIIKKKKTKCLYSQGEK